MKFFLDSALLNEVEIASKWGIVEGVTTNPSLLKKALSESKIDDLEIYIRSLLKCMNRLHVSLEITKTSPEEAIEEARALYKMFNHTARNVCIKIPICLSGSKDSLVDGLKVISEVSKMKIPVNATLIFSPEQALLAAKAGAKFVSPFVGRFDDFLRDSASVEYGKGDYFPKDGFVKDGVLLNDGGIVSGVDLVKKCVNLLDKHNLKTEVIAASLRNARQVRECFEVNAHIATIPFSLFNEVLIHDKTLEGVKKFEEDVVSEYVALTKK